MAHLTNVSRELSSTQVLLRFCLRLAILVAFAVFSSIDFSRSLAALLWMSIILSAIVGAVRREPVLGNALTHWDEAVGYAALLFLIRAFEHFGPV